MVLLALRSWKILDLVSLAGFPLRLEMCKIKTVAQFKKNQKKKRIFDKKQKISFKSSYMFHKRKISQTCNRNTLFPPSIVQNFTFGQKTIALRIRILLTIFNIVKAFTVDVQPYQHAAGFERPFLHRIHENYVFFPQSPLVESSTNSHCLKYGFYFAEEKNCTMILSWTEIFYPLDNTWTQPCVVLRSNFVVRSLTKALWKCYLLTYSKVASFP